MQQLTTAFPEDILLTNWKFPAFLGFLFLQTVISPKLSQQGIFLVIGCGPVLLQPFSAALSIFRHVVVD